MLVHGNHPESLRDLLVAWVRRYPLAPLETETLLVHSNGVAQWLRLALAEDMDDGRAVAAGSRPGSTCRCPRALWQAYRAVLGRDGVPEVSPFDKPLLLWRLMRLLPDVMAEPAYAPLRRFLARDADLRKRFQLAERLADLFDQYQVSRRLAGRLGGGRRRADQGEWRPPPLSDEQRWQACLWRALLADVAAAGGSALAGQGRAAVHEAFLRRVDAWPEGSERPAGLPRRVIVFGISSMPRQSLEVLAALARWAQVLMCVHNPCEHYWADIVADKELLRATHSRQQRGAGRAPRSPRRTCTSSPTRCWPPGASRARLHRPARRARQRHRPRRLPAALRGHPPAHRPVLVPRPSSLLNQLQDDIRDLRPLSQTRPNGRRWRRATTRSASTSPTAPSARSRCCTTSCSPPSTPTRRCARAT
jgi:exodeoxyribonuclease V gamma subunit